MKKILFKTVADEWLDYYEGKVKASTFIMYKRLVNQLKNNFSQNFINDIDTLTAQKYLNNLHSKKYSKSTISKNKITLTLVFKYAVEQRYIKNNICDNLYIPKGSPVQKRKPLNDTEIQNILNNINNPTYLYPLFLLTLGIRRSEALALNWEDINIEKRIVVVSKTIEYVGNNPNLCNYLKNKDEKRIVPILPCVYDLFNNLKKENRSGIIFNKDGDYLLETQINAIWKNFRKVSSLDITQHQMRHTYATMLYKSGVDMKSAMSLLGHKNIKMIMEVYAHTDYDMIIKSSQILGDFIKEKFSI